MRKFFLLVIVAVLTVITIEAQNAGELERSIRESLTGKMVVIWEKNKYFKDLEVEKYYELESLENIILRREYNSTSNSRINIIEADFIFKREGEKRTVRRRFVYRDISSWDAGAVDEGMKIGNYGLAPYLYIKTGRLESGHAAWGSFYNFYYGKSVWRPFSQSINLNAVASETTFLIRDESLIKAWNVFTGRERNNLRSQSELVDLLTIPPWIRPREMLEGEKVALYWDECVILEAKEENGKHVYLMCINDKTSEALYRRFLLETGRGRPGNKLTMEVIYAQYVGNDKEGRMRFKEVENWF
ncbi:MAG: hypothetical protein FWG07_10390 [Treponema sp.]|nr:hypothetical protein [Treponema sp.]